MTVAQALEALEIICAPFDTCHRCGRKVLAKKRGMRICDTAWCETTFPGGTGLCPSIKQIRARARVLRELAKLGIILEPPTERYAERELNKESLRRLKQKLARARQAGIRLKYLQRDGS